MSRLGADEFSQDFIVADALMSVRTRVECPPLPLRLKLIRHQA